MSRCQIVFPPRAARTIVRDMYHTVEPSIACFFCVGRVGRRSSFPSRAASLTPDFSVADFLQPDPATSALTRKLPRPQQKHTRSSRGSSDCPPERSFRGVGIFALAEDIAIFRASVWGVKAFGEIVARASTQVAESLSECRRLRPACQAQARELAASAGRSCAA